MFAIANGPKIAYFSMEIGLTNAIPTYAGGLGMLAGDVVRSSADLKLPLVALSLISRKGYFRQEITRQGQQVEHPATWNPPDHLQQLPVTTTVPIENRKVTIQPWRYDVQSVTGGVVPVLLLDTDIPSNAPDDRAITHFLYGGDNRYRLKQELVLGIGGVRILDALGFTIRKYHLNEGHSALLALELLKRLNLNVDRVRDLCVFTTHTPVDAGHDQFPYDMVDHVLGEFVPFPLLKQLAGTERLNMTRLALNLSEYVNGVAKRHREASQEMFRGYEIHAITNGVHPYTWTCDAFKQLFDKYLPGWANEPELLVRVSLIPDEEIWHAHRQAKQTLINYIKRTQNVPLDVETLTIGFARRVTGYKRPTLLFSNLEALRRVSKHGRLQLIFAGKAHPHDESGKRLIRDIYGYMETLQDDIPLVYLADYNFTLAQKLIPGVDVWLNTPLPPLEASGTSGMKAALNGVINFSVLDGWWIEGWVEGITGWAIGPHPTEILPDEARRHKEREDLYNKLEYLVVPMYYQRRDEWTRMMEHSIGKIAYYFNSHRMMLRYVTEAYL